MYHSIGDGRAQQQNVLSHTLGNPGVGSFHATVSGDKCNQKMEAAPDIFSTQATQLFHSEPRPLASHGLGRRCSSASLANGLA